jgi:hypothetical protein
MVEYEIEGVDENKKQQLLSMLQRLIERVPNDNPITKVIVTADFGAMVRHLIPAESGEEYDPIHEYGAAVAKTIDSIHNDHLRFVIVFDASNFKEISVHAFAVVIHELVHVEQFLLKFKSIGRDMYLRRKNALALARGSKLDTLLELSSVICEEYDAERYSWEIVMDICKSVDPQTELLPGGTMAFADDVIVHLKNLDSFLLRNIGNYRRWQIDTTTITHSTVSKIVRILMGVSYVYALQAISVDVRKRILEIEHEKNYLRFFGSNGTTIVECLDKFYKNRDPYVSDLLQRIAESIDKILLACGIELNDAESGFLVIVHNIDNS